VVLPVIAIDGARFSEPYAGRALPAVIAREVIAPDDAAALRASLLAAPRTRFDLAPRGRYAIVDARVAELEAAALTFSAAVVGRPLELVRARVLVFGRGDYALRRDDGDDVLGLVEATIDLSEHATGEADVVYARGSGEIVFALPELPGSIAVVARAPGVRRYERYLTHRVDSREVVRVRLVMR
jgi:hypothetical protein